MSAQDTTPWSDERTARAIQLQTDGLSASQIARELGGGLSRNAVIGKLKRSGNGGKYSRSQGGERAPIFRMPRIRTPERRGEELNFARRMAGKRESTSPKNRAQRQAAAAQLREEFACTEIIDLTPEQSATKCTLMELNRHTCRFPLGNPQQPDFGYCGAEPMEDRPYCGRHWHITHQPRVSRETVRA